MSNVSPGVFSKIIPLENYVQEVPSSIGMVAALTEKGPDNQLLFVGGRSELIQNWGEPDVHKYGRSYGQGPYIAYMFLGESGALYFMRCLPDNAAYSNIVLNGVIPADTTTAISLSITTGTGLNSLSDLNTTLSDSTAAPTVKPLCVFYPVGRGEYYNKVSIKITDFSNPMTDDTYVLDIYEKQIDGSDAIVESFVISFNPNAVDQSINSIFVESVLKNYSNILRASVQITSDEYSSGFDLLAKVFDNDIGTVTVVATSNSGSVTDNKQDFTAWLNQAATGVYQIEVKDEIGQKLVGYISTSATNNGTTITVFKDRNLATAGWNNTTNETTAFRTAGISTYRIKKSFLSPATLFASSEISLKKGSDGDLLNANGSLNTVTASEILSSGYEGSLKNPLTGVDEDSILDTENVYFSLVYDAGYPKDVKASIVTLATTRRDCMAILDNGDNSSYNAAITARITDQVFNTYLAAIYEEYGKVYDSFIGQDVWFSPVYHMAYILPRNDNVKELWNAPAGYDYAINSLKELRFSPKLGQRDGMYLKQMNPIVKFSNGYIPYGQLTSQSKKDPMQDVNIVRLVLYCDRALKDYCRYFIFQQNDSITWSRCHNGVIGFLEDIKKRRGLDSYSVEVSASDYEKKVKKFHVNIILYPTRTVEQINLNFMIG